MTLFLLLWAASGHTASLFDPQYRFRTLVTEHFAIHFHQGEDNLAAQLAAVAEETWHGLERPLGIKPPPMTHVVLADQTELANGAAYTLPRNTIVITATWPAGSELLGNIRDWLRLVMTHEFTHIVHLDRSQSWARIIRNILGRTPIAFPNLYLPAWQLEGLATYQESALTGEGRLHAGDFRAVIGEAARANRIEPLDRVGGRLVDWPGGVAPYAYGLGFHAYLADRYGPERFRALADNTARHVPYTAFGAFRNVYARPLGSLWKEYIASLRPTPTVSTDDPARRLTNHGFIVSGPRFVGSTCSTCPAEVVYSVQTPHDFPSIKRLARDGSAPEQLAKRYLGSTIAVGRQTIYFDQQDIVRNTGMYSDLYALTRATRRVKRVTEGARLMDPDLSPDEQTLVAVRNRPGQRDLVLVPLATPAEATAVGRSVITLVSEPNTQFNAPRWSPDGRAIAVEHHRFGALPEIAVVDVATGAIRTVASDANTRWVTPAWRPDGGAIVAAASINDAAFNLYEVDLDDPTLRRQLTHTTGGAKWPDVSTDGSTIVYVGYTADGFDLFEMPYPKSPSNLATPPNPTSLANPSNVANLANPLNPATARRYSPWRTLVPNWWWPIITGSRNQLRVGAATSAADVLGYHSYSATMTRYVTAPVATPTADVNTPNWRFVYTYGRWVPTMWVSASREASFFAGPPTDRGIPSAATVRSRQLELGISLPVRRVGVSQTALLTLVRAANVFTYPDHSDSQTRTAVRTGWAISSAQTYGYSISQEGGAGLAVTAELVPRPADLSAGAFAVTTDARAYLAAFAPHHVLALRLAHGTSSGDRNLRRTFNLGGSDTSADPLDFGGGAISLLRGFPPNTFAGNHVALFNADYRWPLAHPQRGLGLWPFFLQTVHAAVFADAGHAWTRTFRARDIKIAAGAEVSADAVGGYWFPFSATVGAAWGHDGSHAVPDQTSVYLRFGRAF